MPSPLHVVRAAIMALVAAVGALVILYAWRLPPFQSSVEITENAYVRGQVTIISPQLAGIVTEVAVQDFQHVRSGDLLARIDDRLYEQHLRQARAALAIQRANLANADQNQRSAEARIRSSEAQGDGARASLDTAEANERRIGALLARGVAAQSAADQARSSLAQSRMAVRQAQAALDVARQELQS